MKTRPYTVLLAMLAGWINRHQQDVIEYLREVNNILQKKLGKKTNYIRLRQFCVTCFIATVVVYRDCDR